MSLVRTFLVHDQFHFSLLVVFHGCFLRFILVGRVAVSDATYHRFWTLVSMRKGRTDLQLGNCA